MHHPHVHNTCMNIFLFLAPVISFILITCTVLYVRYLEWLCQVKIVAGCVSLLHKLYMYVPQVHVIHVTMWHSHTSNMLRGKNIDWVLVWATKTLQVLSLQNAHDDLCFSFDRSLSFPILFIKEKMFVATCRNKKYVRCWYPHIYTHQLIHVSCTI